VLTVQTSGGKPFSFQTPEPGVTTLAALSDVSVTDGAGSTGKYLAYNGSLWVASGVTAGDTTLGALSDIDFTTEGANKFLAHVSSGGKAFSFQAPTAGVTGVGLSGTPRTGTIVLAPGTNITIVESPTGTFTFAASGGGSSFVPLTWNTMLGSGASSHVGNGQWLISGGSGNNAYSGDVVLTLNVGDRLEIDAAAYIAGGLNFAGIAFADETLGVLTARLWANGFDGECDLQINGGETQVGAANTNGAEYYMSIYRLATNLFLFTARIGTYFVQNLFTVSGVGTSFVLGAVVPNSGAGTMVVQMQYKITTGN
jgi:hypothetical protein